MPLLSSLVGLGSLLPCSAHISSAAHQQLRTTQSVGVAKTLEQLSASTQWEKRVKSAWLLTSLVGGGGEGIRTGKAGAGMCDKIKASRLLGPHLGFT